MTIVLSNPKRSIFSLKIRAREASISFAINTPSPVNRDAIKKNFPELKGIRVLRNGLYLGEVRKNRFIPSYSLALTLTKEDVKRSYDYPSDSEEIKKYIHGETLEGTGNKGFGVLFVDGYPLSFYKESNQVKNLFPKGLRR